MYKNSSYSQKFLVHLWPLAYFTNGPNSAASMAPTLIRHCCWPTVGIIRVVSPKIFSNFLRIISGNLFLFFPENFRNDFTGNFLPLQTFQIPVHLLTKTLFRGFFTAPADYMFNNHMCIFNNHICSCFHLDPQWFPAYL